MNNPKDKEQPKRKSPRLHGFDYSKGGLYFLTICTQDRKNILSDVVGKGSFLPSSSINPKIELKLLYCGKITDKWINKIPEKFPGTYVDCYVIMPNHIHIILRITPNAAGGRGDPSPTKTAVASTNSVVGWLKYSITREINCKTDRTGEKVFQRSYYDHIIRDREDYYRIYKYVTENPLCWQTDTLYVE